MQRLLCRAMFSLCGCPRSAHAYRNQLLEMFSKTWWTVTFPPRIAAASPRCSVTISTRNRNQKLRTRSENTRTVHRLVVTCLWKLPQRLQWSYLTTIFMWNLVHFSVLLHVNATLACCHTTSLLSSGCVLRSFKNWTATIQDAKYNLNAFVSIDSFQRFLTYLPTY